MDANYFLFPINIEASPRHRSPLYEPHHKAPEWRGCGKEGSGVDYGEEGDGGTDASFRSNFNIPGRSSGFTIQIL